MCLVSVIITTLNRPLPLLAAVRSVLAQTMQDFEIIVIIDGPTEASFDEVRAIDDARLKIVALTENVGLAEARNQGILRATGKYVAILDDDDEWLPEKLFLQTQKAAELGGDYIFVPGRFIERTATLTRIMPAKLPSPGQDFSEYIYYDGGYLQPSMYFASRQLLTEVPFTKGLRYIEDSDWLLRATRHPQLKIGFVEEPVSIYHNFKAGTRESELTPWRIPFEWAITNHVLFTRRAFPFFIGRLCISARRAKEPISTFFLLLGTARRYGMLTPKVVAFFVAYWSFSDSTLRKLRKMLPGQSTG